MKSLAVLLLLSCLCGSSVARLVDDAAMGITRYDFRGVWNKVPGILTVYLRPICIGRTLFVRGVMGVITVKLEADSTEGYTAPPWLVDYSWSLSLVDRSTNISTKVRVFKTVDRGERTLTFSQLEAQLQVPNQLDLFVEGSPWRHELYLPDCVLTEDADHHPLTQLPGSLFNDKHWLVVMLPRTLPVPLERYSELLLSHMRYHQQLGFAGTLLLCDLHQAHDLTQQQGITEAMDMDDIIMWPWHHEQPRQNYQMYWQVPRYQLVAVAGWGHAMRAAFMDVDDFMVIPDRTSISKEDSCLGLQGSQMDLLHQLHWEASLPPGATVTVSGSSSSSDSDSTDNSNDNSSDSSSSSSSSTEGAAAAVLRLSRFDALIEGSSCSSPEICLQQHHKWYQQSGLRLAVSTCPVEQGGIRASRRPVVSPHDVVAVRVYTASPRGGKLTGPNSPAECAYMLHISNLLGPAKPWGNTLAAEWQVHAEGGPGMVVYTAGQLPKRQSLTECQVQDSSYAAPATAAAYAAGDAGPSLPGFNVQ